jgi:4-hydroxybenzoate polyprenyltransferase
LALAKIEFPQSSLAHDLWIALACSFGAILMRGAGCTWNDIIDRNFDAQVARTKSRPLPSGQVSTKRAALWMGLQILLAGVLLLTFTPLAIGLGLSSLSLVAVYPFAKRFTWWPQVFLGLAFNWGIFVAGTAHSGRMALSFVLLWAGGITWTLFYDTIYAHQDKEDDALIGVKSTARLFGDQGTKPWLMGFLCMTIALCALALGLALQRIVSLQGVFAFGGLLGFSVHLLWQWHKLDSQNPALCLILFRANKSAGLIFALFLAVAAWG